jgi:hypothetical protein
LKNFFAHGINYITGFCGTMMLLLRQFIPIRRNSVRDSVRY